MKKLMKVLALATAICMLLSVSAFAASTVEGNTTTKKIAITIDTGKATSEEVAVLIVKSSVANLAEVQDSDIMYINQVSAENGIYDLGTVEILDDTELVDVYIGSAKLGVATKINSAPIDLNEVVEKLEINATAGGVKIANYSKEALAAAGQATDVEGGTGVEINLDYVVKSAIKDVIWAFTIDNDAANKKYSVKTSYADFNVFENQSTIQLAAAFSNSGTPLNVTDVDVIVRTADGSVLFTDELNDKPKGPQAN